MELQITILRDFFNFKNCQDLVNEIFSPQIDLKFRKLTGKLIK